MVRTRTDSASDFRSKQFRSEAKGLERAHLAQHFASTHPGQTHWRQFTGKTIQVDFVRAKDSKITAGGANGSVNVNPKIGKKIRPNPQDVMLHPTGLGDAGGKAGIEHLSRSSAVSIADRLTGEARSAGEHHAGIESRGQCDTDL